MSANHNESEFGPREGGTVASRVLIVCLHDHPEGGYKLDELMSTVREAGCTIYYTGIHRYEICYETLVGQVDPLGYLAEDPKDPKIHYSPKVLQHVKEQKDLK